MVGKAFCVKGEEGALMGRSTAEIGEVIYKLADEIDEGIDILRAAPNGEMDRETIRRITDAGLVKIIPVMLELQIADELIRKNQDSN